MPVTPLSDTESVAPDERTLAELLAGLPHYTSYFDNLQMAPSPAYMFDVEWRQSDRPISRADLDTIICM